MVKVGDYTVQLVAADTKEPFKEHTAPDGQVYVEVEPDMDYFIAVRSDVGGVKMEFHVDGVDLGYYSDFLQSDGSKYYEGSLERNGGRETMTALRFYKTRQDKGAAAQSTILGKVEVKIFSLGQEFYTEPYDIASASLDADSTLGGEKSIKTTTSGSQSFDCTPEDHAASSKIVDYEYGEHLQTITLNYCSAFGLIYHKILPPPLDSSGDGSTPVKRERLMKRKRSSETPASTEATRVSPEGKKTSQDDEELQMVTVQKTYEVVDLTGDE